MAKYPRFDFRNKKANKHKMLDQHKDLKIGKMFDKSKKSKKKTIDIEEDS